MGIAASGNLQPGQGEPVRAHPRLGAQASPVAAIMAISMMLDYLGQPQASQAVENSVAELLGSKRLTGVGTGDHPTDAVGDMVVAELRSVAAKV